MKEITKAQEEILKALWQVKEGAVGDILNKLKEPKPAYTTVATVLKVLENKGYISHKTFGKTNVYFATITKNKYSKHILKGIFNDLLGNSLQQMVSPFINNKKVSIKELEEIKRLIDIEIKKKEK